LTFDRNKTPEERAIYQLLVMLIEAYETKYYPIPTSTPQEILLHILEASGMDRSDLVGKIGSIDEVSAIIEGEKAINKAQSKVLGDMFKVSPNLFI
jgi:HTH-type transcriptional regulator / antitoxin HigA